MLLHKKKVVPRDVKVGVLVQLPGWEKICLRAFWEFVPRIKASGEHSPETPIIFHDAVKFFQELEDGRLDFGLVHTKRGNEVSAHLFEIWRNFTICTTVGEQPVFSLDKSICGGCFHLISAVSHIDGKINRNKTAYVFTTNQTAELANVFTLLKAANLDLVWLKSFGSDAFGRVTCYVEALRPNGEWPNGISRSIKDVVPKALDLGRFSSFNRMMYIDPKEVFARQS